MTSALEGRRGYRKSRLSKEGCVKMETSGRGESRISENFADIINEWPPDSVVG